jgi:protein-disulfide isomerase
MSIRTTAAALLVSALAVVAQPGTLRAEEVDAAFGAKVRAYLLAHPEVLEEAIDALQAKRQTERVAMQKAAVEKAGAALYDSPANVVLGNPKGDVTIVEFFDYNCGYCKRAFPDMLALLASDTKLRFILKEFPVLGPGSQEAATIAAAVLRLAPMRYQDFHRRLITVRGEVNRAKAMEVAVAVGLDAAKVEAEAKSPDVLASIDATRELADTLGITGTPSYVIAGDVVPGAVGADQLRARIAAARR